MGLGIRGKKGNRESHEGRQKLETWETDEHSFQAQASSPSAPRHGGLAGGGQFTLVQPFSEDPGLVGVQGKNLWSSS